VRVLHVNKFVYRRGGAESYLLDLAALQRAAGHEVALWGMHHPANPAGLPLADTFASCVELEPPPAGPARVRAAARMVWSRECAAGLARAVDRFDPDVVHFHNVYHQLSPSVLAGPVRGRARGVLTLHDYKLACPSYQMLDHGVPCRACVDHGPWQAARRRCKDGSLAASAMLSVESALHRRVGAYGQVDALVSPSRFLAGVVREAGVDHGRLHVIPHFAVVPTPSVPPVPSVPSVPSVPPVPPGAREPYVAVAGRLSAEKGVDTAVRAVGALPGVRLRIAGEGAERDRLHRLAAQLAPGRVELLGRLGREEVAGLLAGAVATVVPSRWYENQPMTVLESYAVGVPVVASRLGGLPELVDDGVDGVLVPHDDAGALTAALAGLVADPARAARMGTVGRAKVERDFSVGAHLAALHELYAGARGA